MVPINKKLIEAEKHINHLQAGRIIDLSNEALHAQDYKFLSSIIKRAALLEKLKLPKFEKMHEEVFALIDEATIFNSSLINLHIEDFSFSQCLNPQVEKYYNNIQSRLARNKKRIFAIHGGGNIGLGLMADIVTRSPFSYKIMATSSDQFIVNLINSQGQLWLRHPVRLDSESTCVKNVFMCDARDKKNIIDLYAQANIAAICLTEAGFINVSIDIANGLISRYQMDQAGLKILVLMNKTNCDVFVKNTIETKLLSLLNDSNQVKEVLSKIQFIPTMVDRISNKIAKEKVVIQLKEQLISLNNSSQNDMYSKKTFREQILNVINNPIKLKQAICDFNLKYDLFNVEPYFSLYVPQGFDEGRRFPSLTMTKNLNLFMQVKNKYINGPHAVLAWVGALMGYSTMAAVIKNPILLGFIKNLMDKEIAPILKAEYPELQSKELAALQYTFLERCKTNLEDPVKRVGRDPLRKLNVGACVRGILDLKQKHKLKLTTPRLELGMAAAILYAIKNIDSTNSECQKMQEIYLRNGSYEAILSYKGSNGNSGHYFGLNKIKDKTIINNILIRISFLENIFKLKPEQRLNVIGALLSARTYKDFCKIVKLRKSRMLRISNLDRFSKTMLRKQNAYRFLNVMPHSFYLKSKYLTPKLGHHLKKFCYKHITIANKGMIAKIKKIYISSH